MWRLEVFGDAQAFAPGKLAASPSVRLAGRHIQRGRGRGPDAGVPQDQQLQRGEQSGSIVVPVILIIDSADIQTP